MYHPIFEKLQASFVVNKSYLYIIGPFRDNNFSVYGCKFGGKVDLVLVNSGIF